MSTYVISDIHSCYTKFIKSIPSDTKKLIILGDLFNKGREQIEMFTWVMQNRFNPKYVFVRGNCELRANNEIVRHCCPEKTKLYFPWFGSHDGYSGEKNKNIANVIIDLIEHDRYKLEDVLDLFQNVFKWYHIEGNWIMSHASWQVNKTPPQQNVLNLAYDVDNLLAKLRKADYDPDVPKIYKGMKFIIGHTPIYHFSKQEAPPVILKNRFYFIDNGIYKTSRPIFYLKIK